MADGERWHEWTPSVRSIRFLDKGPLALGTRALIRQPRFPPAVWQVTALEPGKSFTWRSGAPGLRVYVESSEPFVPGEPWRELKRARAGQVSYQLFEWRSDDQGGLPGNV